MSHPQLAARLAPQVVELEQAAEPPPVRITILPKATVHSPSLQRKSTTNSAHENGSSTPQPEVVHATGHSPSARVEPKTWQPLEPPFSLERLPAALRSPAWKHDGWPTIRQKVVLLSVFDGISSSLLATISLGAEVTRVITWETDEECCQLVSWHFKVEHWGDFRKTNPSDVVDIIRNLDTSTKLLLTAAPPCPSYSRVMSTTARGREDPEGHKFQEFCDWWKKVEDVCGPQITLLENVVPNVENDCVHFCKEHRCKAVVVDAADYRTISRPRMWYHRFQWPTTVEVHQQTPTNNSKICEAPIRRGRYNNFDRIFVPTKQNDHERTQAVHGNTLPALVANFQRTMPCLTTPAPTSEGRPPPKSKKPASAEAMRRWIADKRQYAPWHYEEHSMMRTKTGLKIPSADEKEVMHHLPRGYTAATDWSERRRCKALANGWHVGIARFLILMCLTQPLVASSQPDAMDRAEAQRMPTQWDDVCDAWSNRVLHVPTMRPLEQMAAIFRALRCRIGPCPSQLRKQHVHFGNPEEHVRWAHSLEHPLDGPCLVDPSVTAAILMLHMFGHNTSSVRHRIVEDLALLHEDMEEDIAEWHMSLPPDSQKLYTSNLAPGNVVPIPLMMTLLTWLGLETTSLSKELSHGFKMVGTLQPGLGWKKREDAYYASPTPLDRFFIENDSYIQSQLDRPHDQHWRSMLDEILEEVFLDRMDGPFEAPPTWKRQTVAPGHSTLKPLPHHRIAVAIAFAIIQTGSDGADKVRRGEDWRRSGHNRTVHVVDAPHHHTVSDYITVGKLLRHGLRQIDLRHMLGHTTDGVHDQQGICPCGGDSTVEDSQCNKAFAFVAHRCLCGCNHKTCCPFGQAIHSAMTGRKVPLDIWGHDHDGAYRQYAAGDAETTYVLLQTPDGPTLWRHRALLFGAVASVWGYNRMGDILCLIARAFLAVPALHYVDDYGGDEYHDTATSAFTTFARLNFWLGALTKPSKEQPPAPTQKVQGTMLEFDHHEDTSTLTIAESRRQKLLQELGNCLRTNVLTHAKAAQLAGKMAFVQRSSFGSLLRGATKALYGRQHSSSNNTKLTESIRASLLSLLGFLQDPKPKIRPLRARSHSPSIIYADAFDRRGDIAKLKHIRSAHAAAQMRNEAFAPALSANDNEAFAPGHGKHPSNGWGFLAFLRNGTTCYMAGTVPEAVTKAFSPTLAYIYFLETLAQIIPLTVLHDLLTDEYLSFVDNEASKHALIKGYSGCTPVNNLIAATWRLCSCCNKEPWFDRVSSADNPSDAVSRFDFTESERNGHVRLSVDMSDFYEIILHLAHDEIWAHNAGHEALLEWSSRVRPNILQQIGCHHSRQPSQGQTAVVADTPNEQCLLQAVPGPTA